MLVWSSPLWLLALAVLPLIWWLHKFQAQGTAIPVSSLLYWKSSKNDAKALKRGAKLDPLWLLRALIASLLIFSAAGPLWVENAQHNIHAWFDDSFSMQARENDNDRTELALEELLTRLKSLERVQAKIFSLSDPTYTPLLLETGSEALWKNKLRSWLKIRSAEMYVPPASQLSTEGEHWLVTDGASQELNDWLTTSPIQQLIQVGQATENSAITLLSIRPGLKTSRTWNGLIQLNHYGLKPVERTLELVSGSHRLNQWTVTLTPEQSRHIDFEIDIGDLSEQQLLIRFVNPDSLPEDDQLSLFPVIQVPTRIHGNCPQPLIAAINTHPFLNTGIPGSIKAELNIVCDDEVVNQQGKVIRFHQSNQPEKLDSAAVWLQSAEGLGNLFLQSSWLAHVKKNHEPINSYPVLIADKTSLITLTESPQRALDCYLDMNWPDFIYRPEYPVLVAGLIDRVLGSAILDNILTAERVANESRIKPLPIRQPASIDNVVNQSVAFDFTPYLIVVAIILLLADGWLLRKKHLQQGRIVP